MIIKNNLKAGLKVHLDKYYTLYHGVSNEIYQHCFPLLDPYFKKADPGGYFFVGSVQAFYAAALGKAEFVLLMDNSFMQIRNNILFKALLKKISKPMNFKDFKRFIEKEMNYNYKNRVTRLPIYAGAAWR